MINLLDDIWMLLPEHWEVGISVTSVAAEFGIAHSIVSRLWTISNYRAIRGCGHGCREISEWTTDIAFYRGQKTARWWSVCTTPCTVCTFNACPSFQHRNWRDNEWGRVLLQMRQFSLSSKLSRNLEHH
ncbi:hypothetical protein TNCV_2662141 [Trichonephila clavipes]|nr:hypothetical protein TNCV_2662141 [Trichonephila clavipes]